MKKRSKRTITALILLSCLLTAGCGPAPQAYTETLGLERIQPAEVAKLLTENGLPQMCIRDRRITKGRVLHAIRCHFLSLSF